MHPVDTMSRETRRMIFNELRHARKLRHPRIVSCFGVNISRNAAEFHIVSELMFRDLGQALHRDRDILPTLAADPFYRLRIAFNLAEALAFLRANDVVHRDVKPGNVLLDNYQQAKLADFGLARICQFQQLETSNAQRGTPLYKSPEQLTPNAEVSFESDVFMYGMTIAELFTGLRVWDEHTDDMRILTQLVVLKKSPMVRGGIADSDLHALVEQCLKIDPAARPTPRDILAKLENVLRRLGRWEEVVTTTTITPERG
eukprot:TRINITY_DN7786_c0_g1_i1.p2 TRINITY_DN7786_c0_g1~~TRINITY_DN7786_c0_g1_i1.p2  ORF type:complete len:258 (-),score=48.15 TRINITY_DN7786_c0_g1_i1:134-907(-)